MGSLTNYAESAMLDHIAGNTSYSPVATIYLALATADPTDAATGASMNEAANDAGYARIAITFASSTSRRSEQDADITFAETTSNMDTITHWVFLDNGTYGAGNALAYGDFSTTFQPASGNEPVITSGTLYVEVCATSDGAGFTNYTVSNLLDMMFDNTLFSAPFTYTGLSTTVVEDDDVDEGDFAETTGQDYARVRVEANGGSDPTWDFASGGVVSNGANISFAPVGASNWGAFVAAVLVDDSVGACNVLAYDSSNVTGQEPQLNDIVRIQTGSFTMTMT